VDEKERIRIEAVIQFADAITVNRDPFEDGHGKRSAMYATELAAALKKPEEFVEYMHYTMHLHDVGKILIAEVILNKPKLAAAERSMVESHSELGAKIVEAMHFNKFIPETILQIHENWDGTGYPNGYQREEILPSARIARIADCFDAMRSKRPYRDPLTLPFALQMMEMESGKSFDPTMFFVFKRMILNA
jgi:HD-GYP domain-containing protein (c-di-GMP phosphodiesterase class II)